MDINNKVAVITGAASGIGRAVTKQLSERGAKAVAMIDMSEAVEEAAEQLNQQLGAVIAHPFIGDVTHPEFREAVYDRMMEDHGIVSICVPAAGITRDSLAVKINKENGKARIYDLEKFRLVTEVDLIAPIYWALEMVARIAEERFNHGHRQWQPTEGIMGTVIFIGSVSSQGNKGQIAYAASKAGLEGAAATIMKEAMFHGVRTGVIHPGYTNTPMVQALGDELIEKYILPQTQLGRLIRPEEIADAICFMISNSAVSGQLWADAGFHPSA